MHKRYSVMGFTCSSCNTMTNRVDEVGITDNFEARFEWNCPKCRRQIAVVSTFEDLSKLAPKPVEISETEFDRKFLASAHISGMRDEGEE